MKTYFTKNLPVEGELQIGDRYIEGTFLSSILEKGYINELKTTKKLAGKKKAKLFLSSRDIQIGDMVYRKEFPNEPWKVYAKLRTGNSPEALAYLDCSEFVSRVLDYDGITNGVQQFNTKDLLNFLSDDDKFICSKNEPQPGDIFLWRSDVSLR